MFRRRLPAIGQNRWFIDSRQVNLERGSHTFLAIYKDVPLALLHDSINRTQSQSRTFAKALRRKERLEDMSYGVFVHARAGIAHSKLHVTPGNDSHVSAREFFIEFSVRGLDRQLSAMWHRVTSVDRQVHDDLLDLAGIGAHRA